MLVDAAFVIEMLCNFRTGIWPDGATAPCYDDCIVANDYLHGRNRRGAPTRDSYAHGHLHTARHPNLWTQCPAVHLTLATPAVARWLPPRLVPHGCTCDHPRVRRADR